MNTLIRWSLIRWGLIRRDLIRWAKFNLVGAMGMALQLALLATISRWTAGHYLIASAVAIELTLLHNFVWHLDYTWKDRRDGSSRISQLTRFHLSNGLVSMTGNLVLMRILVQEAHLPLLVANSVAILCCSLINFCLGDSWTFVLETHPHPGKIGTLSQTLCTSTKGSLDQ